MSPRFVSVLRWLHRWGSAIVAVPLLVVLATGIALQVRKPVEYLQPSAAKGSAPLAPSIRPAEVLAGVRSVPGFDAVVWKDIVFTDYRPKKSVIKVHLAGHYEVQIDAGSGAVLKHGQRRNDILNAIHDGSYFNARLWLFLPAAVLVMFLVFSGTFLAIWTSATRVRGARARSKSALAAPTRQAPATDPLKKTSRRRFTQFCLDYHYWLALVVLVPWLVVVCSGMVLQLRYEIPGVMPPALQAAQSSTTDLSYQQVLDSATAIAKLEVSDWSDIWRVYTYPARGVMEIRTKRGVSAILDSNSGAIMWSGSRESDFWEDVHQGIFGRHQLSNFDWFGMSKLDLSMAVFLPVHIVALLLWFTGVAYFISSEVAMRRRQRRRGAMLIDEAQLNARHPTRPGAGQASPLRPAASDASVRQPES